MPWPLPLRAIETRDMMPPELALSAPLSGQAQASQQATPSGLICTPIAQTPAAYFQYLWQQHLLGATLAPAVIQVWRHLGWITSETQGKKNLASKAPNSALTDLKLPATNKNQAKPRSPQTTQKLTTHQQADIDLIDEWWYLLMEAIVSEGYGGLCWLDEDELDAS